MNIFAKQKKEGEVSVGGKYIWFSLGSGMYAASTMIFTVMITRLSGEVVAGMFAIGLSIAQWLVTIAYFEIRTFQVTDVQYQYSCSDYLSLRVLLCCAASGICICYSIAMGYGGIKLKIVLLLFVFKLLEGIADVYEGEFQRLDRIDISGKSMFYRTCVALVSLTGILYVTKNIVIALIGMNVCVLGVMFFLNIFALPDWKTVRVRIDKGSLRDIFRCCLPLAVCSFLSTYLINSSKLVVDRVMGDEFQLYYTAVFMPNLVINLLSGIVFKPMQSTLAKQYADGKKREMGRTVVKIVLMIVGITVSCIFGGYVIGLRLLEIFYAVDLFEYRHVLTILLVAGGVNAINIILYYCLAIQRKQNRMPILYVVVSVGSLPILNCFVGNMGLMGAAWGYLITVLILGILLTGCIFVKGKREYEQAV